MRLTALHLFLFLTVISFAQETDIHLKNVSDTILNTKRTLKIADPFNAETTMLQLFTGNIYHYADKNTFISWKCKSCKPAAYIDVNGTEGDQLFPYTQGVATRLLENFDYADSKGNQFKLLFFNHSENDEDGLQTGRFFGGLVGVAKFAKNGTIWEMKSFQPAIAAFGSFSQAPKPKLVEIGENQYAFTILHTNGGAGAPYNGYLYLIAGFDGKYQPLMEVDYYTLSNSISSNWSSSYTVITDNNKKFFRDFIIKTTGSYKKAKNTEDDFEVDLPAELATTAKTKKQFDFAIERRFEFKGKFYKMIGKPVVKIFNAK
ncbi:glycoside hydrolase family 68 protein [Flavobacterium zhairuonense]|uniref:glycoside hydrolase family 68 protein n=1 Tax=Flavobacterium zhairuonense TaxID=2493631 RepID=UPI00104CF1F0|nr:glycoside hydrolase family 68 protein [Flavobacterium zhairuonense]KAF2506802.1 glycoside hydrolase family 68 protein [Flavobacterium zhairuonense]